MRFRIIMVAAMLLIVALGGCGDAQPILAGGKPVSHWVEAARHTDAGVRKHAVQKLGNVGPADPSVVPTLKAALQDRAAAVRCEAILALLKCGPAANDAVPILTELREHDRDAQVRAFASKALQALQGSTSR